MSPKSVYRSQNRPRSASERRHSQNFGEAHGEATKKMKTLIAGADYLELQRNVFELPKAEEGSLISLGSITVNRAMHARGMSCMHARISYIHTSVAYVHSTYTRTHFFIRIYFIRIMRLKFPKI